jgi:acetyl-CoA synthetase
MTEGRDRWWHDVVAGQPRLAHKAEPFDSEHPLFILYTSGSHREAEGHPPHHGRLPPRLPHDDEVRLRPEGRGRLLLHRRRRLGHRPQLRRLRPLSNGGTVLMYEGAPNHPEPDRFWRSSTSTTSTILYTAPTAIRAFMRWGDDW